MTAPITLFLVDDHDVVRRGLRAYVEVLPGMRVVGEAPDGEQAIARIDALAAGGAEPTVVLMDLVLPGMDGVAATAELLRRHPRLRVLVLTSFGGKQRVQMALAAGAAGYLLKTADVDEVANAILAVARGEVHLDSDAAEYLMREQADLRALTPRELEVLGLLAEGCSNQEIARRLAITERTARTHVSNLLGKLHLGSRTQAALLAQRDGLHPPPRRAAAVHPGSFALPPAQLDAQRPKEAPMRWQARYAHAAPIGSGQAPTRPDRIRSARKAIAATGLAALVAALLAACGQQSTTAMGTSAPKAGNSNVSIPAGKELAHLQQVVTAAQAPVSGSFSPGPAIKDMAALKGKKIMALPGTSEIPTCLQDVRTLKSIGDAAGTPVTVMSDSGAISQWDTAINSAITQHYAAVDFICDDTPSLIGPEIEKARAAGVEVYGYGLTMPLTQQNYPGLYGGTAEPIWNDYSTMLDQAFVASGGKPINILIISSVAVIGNAQDVAMLKTQISQQCGSACHVYVVNIEVPDWPTKIQPEVQAQLLSHPDINVVYPMFSGEYSFVLPAVQGSHKNVPVTGAFGGGTPQLKLQTNPATNKIIIGDMTSWPVWAAYEMYYQTMLGLAGQPMVPVNSTYTPNILATSANAGKMVTGQAWGYGFVNTYRKLLGLPPLSGAALQAAATVGS